MDRIQIRISVRLRRLPILLCSFRGNRIAGRPSGRRYTAFIGNFGTRGSEGVTADIPADLFAQLENVIKLDSLTGDLHWFRFFFCNVAGQRTFESLKDNETWGAGTRCLESVQWADSMGYYSVRLFVVLRAS
ncbi:DUF6348 family protein [Duganella rivi]|uniref:DUF6348 family protein n=1 Tax=Duganella rivi TaxID=2666083 RepID=UPI0035305F12